MPVDGIFIIRTIVSTAIAAVDRVCIMDSDAIYTGIAIDKIAIVRLNGIATIRVFSRITPSTMNLIAVTSGNFISVSTTVDIAIKASNRNDIIIVATVDTPRITACNCNVVDIIAAVNSVIDIIILFNVIGTGITEDIIPRAIHRDIVCTIITMDSITSTSNRDFIITIPSINYMATIASDIKEIWIGYAINRSSITT